MKPPIFATQHISNHGTSNPIVARLGLQSIELLKFVDLTDLERDNASTLLFDIQFRLLRCYDCLDRLKHNNRETLEKTDIYFGKGSIEIPFIINLRDETEDFLSSSKQFLRDMVALINKIYRADLKEDSKVLWDRNGGASEAAAWSERIFGPEHALTHIFRSNAGWIADLIKRRNAMEHPRGYSGTLVIENYRVVGPTIAAPSWRRDAGGKQGETTDVLPHLERLLNLLLEFGEEIVVQGVITRPVHEHIAMYEIPAEKREPSNPARFKASLSEFLLKRLKEAEDKKP